MAKQNLFEEGDPFFSPPPPSPDPLIHDRQMRKLSSPCKQHYRIIEMATPVTATTRNQHTYDTRTVHVNNLRYAHIDNCQDNPTKDSGFPYKAVGTPAYTTPKASKDAYRHS